MMRLIVLAVLIISAIVTVNAQPVITLNYHTLPERPAPGYFIISIDISNTGSDSKNLEIYVYENEDDFYFINPDGEKTSSMFLEVGDLSAGSTSTQIKAYAERSGIYTFRVKLTYSNVSGSSYGTDAVFSVMVHETPIIYTGDEIEISPGESRVEKITMRNMGGNIKSAIINLNSELITSNSSAIKSWSGGETKAVNVEITAKDDAVEGTYTAWLKIEYRNEFGEKGELTVPILLKVVAAPDIYVRAKTVPEKIYVDSDFTLSVQIAAKNSNLKDLTANILLPDSFSGQKSKYIGNLDAGESVLINFSLKAPKKSGNYNLTFILNEERFYRKFILPVYISDYGNISIDLSGVYTSPQRVIDGTNFKLSLQIENSGRQDAKAVSIKLILPDGIEGRDSYFIGSLESGDSATATFELKAFKAGNHEIAAKVTYLDQTFRKYEVKKSFTIYIFPTDYTTVILAIAAILTALIAVTWYKMRKK